MMKKISLKTASSILILMSILTIILHMLVILKIIPFTWVNGGMSETYEIAFKTSLGGIIVLLLFIPIYLVAGKWLAVKRYKKLVTYSLWILFAFFCFSTVLQFMGTPFEKMCTSIICIISAVMCFRLAIEKR